jgi:hypothetical protein
MRHDRCVATNQAQCCPSGGVTPARAWLRSGAAPNSISCRPNVIAGAVRMVEFLLVAVLGFSIYLAYVEREGANAHLVYLGAVLIAATANMLMFQALDLYRVPAFSAVVRSFTRITVAWTLVMGGLPCVFRGQFEKHLATA